MDRPNIVTAKRESLPGGDDIADGVPLGERVITTVGVGVITVGVGVADGGIVNVGVGIEVGVGVVVGVALGVALCVT